MRIMKMASFALLLVVGGCGENLFKNKITKGPLSRKELEKENGNPLSTYQTPDKQDVYQYSKESFQIVGEDVVYYYREPEEDEKQLSYWMKRWKDDIYHFTEVEQSKDSHLPPPLYYVNYDNNERFLYSQSSNRVEQVIFQLARKDETPEDNSDDENIDN